jgi:hypothetical protein
VALDNYRESVDAGLFKIMSKNGISLLTSYQVGQYKSANTDAAAGTKAQILTQPAVAGRADL